MMEIAASTDRGRVRDRNEDNYAVIQLGQTAHVSSGSLESDAGRSTQRDALMAVVADGMGGEACGDLASRMLIERFVEFATSNAKAIFRSLDVQSGLRELLSAELDASHAMLCRKAELEAALRGMGTTATVAVIVGSRLSIAHVGDSRCYLLRDGRLRQLTRDHSMAQYFIEQGCISSAEAAPSGMQHLLWNALGGNTSKIVVDFHDVKLRDGDDVLLCTDGLTGRLTDDELVDQLRAHEKASAVCDKLITAANIAGGQDNITCVLVRLASEKDTSPPAACFDLHTYDNPIATTFTSLPE